jgi:hypothetical protein
MKMKIKMNSLLLLILLSFSPSSFGFEEEFNQTQFSDTDNLESAKFNHQGIADRQTRSNCEKLNKDFKDGKLGTKGHGDVTGCDANDDESAKAVGQVFGGALGKNLDMMIPIATKAYGVVMGASGAASIVLKLNKQRAIGKAADRQEAGKKLSSNQSKMLEDNKAGTQGGTDYYKTQQSGYVADKDGNMFKDNGDGNYSACPSGDSGCSEAGKKYKKEKEEKEKTDWCNKLPMVTELSAGAIQIFAENKSENDNMSEGEKDLQRGSLETLKSSHKKRALTAQIQAGGWFAASACYIGHIATVQGAASDWKIYLKLAASGFLGTFYQIKTNKHKKYANGIQGLIDEMPSVDKCDPYKHRGCFCNEETSPTTYPTEYRKYCIAAELANNPNQDPIPCVDSNMEIDASCGCQKTGGCIETTLKNTMPIGMNVGSSYSQDSLGTISKLNRGDAKMARLTGAKMNKYSAIGARTLKKFGKNVPKSKVKDKGMVRSIIASGIPTGLATQLAGAHSSTEALALTKAISASLSPDKRRKSKLDLSSGKKAYNRKFKLNKTKTKSNAYNPYSRFKKKKDHRGKKGGIHVVSEFQDRANAAAEISNNSSANIFDIISSRYTRNYLKLTKGQD